MLYLYEITIFIAASVIYIVTSASGIAPPAIHCCASSKLQLAHIQYHTAVLAIAFPKKCFNFLQGYFTFDGVAQEQLLRDLLSRDFILPAFK